MVKPALFHIKKYQDFLWIYLILYPQTWNSLTNIAIIFKTGQLIRTDIRNKILESLVYEKRGTYHYEIHQSWTFLDTNVYQTDIKVYINRSLFFRSIKHFSDGYFYSSSSLSFSSVWFADLEKEIEFRFWWMVEKKINC